MNRWEFYFGSPDEAVKTFDEFNSCMMMDVFHRECTNDPSVHDRCPLYNRCSLDSQIEWLKEEMD